MPRPGAIGIDIVEISRLKKVSGRWGKRFLEKIYTPYELAYARSKRYPEQHLAARFAAKEAIFKALGEETDEFVGWTNVEVRNEPTGKPYVVWYGPARSLLRRKGIRDAVISLSHTHRYAVASAMLVYGRSKRKTRTGR
ncbi:MAG: Holo-[acyl-carrier-protein] synthase [Candidatus Omnitrophica bacterium]|nr:Holo-[acyl-carrier-protein] synthase [Candidatus Omnitrophota bacterium]